MTMKEMDADRHVGMAGRPNRGMLHIYLGAAPGAGKSYAMLQEAWRRKRQGTDVVVGFVEIHGRPRTDSLVTDLEVIAPLEIPHKGFVLQEMNTAAIIARHPEVVLVDELAHTNAPGSKHEKRYQDVQELLAAGIAVISTLDIQHIESLRDVVQRLTGITVTETVPDWVVSEAERVDLVDVEPEELIRRLKRGDIYPPERIKPALEHFFTLKNLAGLRGVALVATSMGLQYHLSDRSGLAGDKVLGDQPRIAVAIDHHPIGEALIRRGWHLARVIPGELVVVSVTPRSNRRQTQTAEEERQLRRNFMLAEDLGAKVTHLRGDVSDQLIKYCRTRRISILIIAHPSHGVWDGILHGSVTSELLHKMPEVDILVVGNRQQDSV